MGKWIRKIQTDNYFWVKNSVKAENINKILKYKAVEAVFKQIGFLFLVSAERAINLELKNKTMLFYSSVLLRANR